MALRFLLDMDDPRFLDGRLFKSSPKAPAAPDPKETAAAQSATNKETAYWNAVLNNVNQTTPYGTLTYTQQGDGTYDPTKPPQFSSQITLSPEQQRLYDLQSGSDIQTAQLGQQQIGRIADSVSSPYSYSGLPAAPSAQDINALSEQGQQAIMSRLDPQFARDEEALRTRLINQGIGQGSQAYNTEFDRFNQAKTDARMQAILQGQNYGAAQQAQQLGLRNQAIGEYTTTRNAPLNEYIGLTSGTQVQNPQFSSQGYQGVQPVDYAGLVNQNYQAKLGAYNQKVASNNSTMGSLFGLGGSILGGFAGSPTGSSTIAGMFSDVRLKENIEHIGEENGYPIYKFNYINIPEKTYVGVMAQDVEKITPDAVFEREGFKAVNYDMIGVEMREYHG